MYAENEYVAVLDSGGKYIEFVYFADKYDEKPTKRYYSKKEKLAELNYQVIASGRSLLFHNKSTDLEVEGNQQTVSFILNKIILYNRIIVYEGRISILSSLLFLLSPIMFR